MKKSITNSKPELVQFFDHKKNYPLTPEKMHSGSNKEIFWLCPKGHGLKQRPNRFMSAGSFLCKKCKTKVYKISKYYPKLVKIFHPTKNHPLTVNSFFPWRFHNAFWTCEDKHYYQETLKRITSNIQEHGIHNCRICVGLEINEQNCLKNIVPKVAKEWDYKKNSPLKPDKVFWKQAKSVHWICSRKHTWTTTIYHRTVSKSNCPHCDMASSLPELRIYSELSHFFKEIRHRYKLLDVEADIYIKNLRIIVEYDGFYYHNSSERLKNDIKKNKLFKENGYNLIRLREGNLPRIEGAIEFERDKFNKSCINKILAKLKELNLEKNLIKKIDAYINSNHFINNKLFQELKINLPAPPFKESLAFISPKLASEWDYKKNHPMRPEHYRPNAYQYAYWRCVKNASHPGWKTLISNRNFKKSGCPDCKPLLVAETLKGSFKKNNLKNRYTNVHQVFDFEKNEIKQLEKINYFSKRIINWKCPYCKHTWKASVQQFFRRLTDKNIKTKKLICENCHKNFNIKLLQKNVKKKSKR